MRFASQSVRQHTVRATTIVALGILVSSCSENKVSQCKKLIDVANQVVTDVQTVAQNASTTTGTTENGSEFAVINRVAEAAESAKAEMEALSLTDENLQAFQSRYAQMYTEISETTRQMINAAETKNREAGKQAYEAFKAATNQEGKLVNEINAYCTN